MPATVKGQSKVEHVSQVLREQIRAGTLKPGDQLAPVRSLAQTHGTSVPTVLKAIEVLAADGMIQRRQGSGNFVGSGQTPLEIEASVTLCMEAGAHVWGELTAALLNRLHERDFFATVIDSQHRSASTFLTRFTQARSDFMVIHGKANFPFRDLLQPAFLPKTIIGAIDWDTDLDVPGLLRVLTDYRAGLDLVISHLRELGHEHVLVVGTTTQIGDIFGQFAHPAAFARAVLPALQAHGMRYQFLASDPDPTRRDYTILPAEKLLPILNRPDAPTAILGLRDLEANEVQRVLRAAGDPHPELAITGYYDTPWAKASDPGITSVNLDIDAVAAAISDRIFARHDGDADTGGDILLPPRLIPRDSTLKRPGPAR